MKAYSNPALLQATMRRTMFAAGGFQLAAIQTAAGGVSGPGNAGYQKNGEGVAQSIGAAELLNAMELPGRVGSGIPKGR